MRARRCLGLYMRGMGFTLVESLVAMALLSVVALALVGVMRSIAQTQTRLDARVASADEMRATASLLKRIVERVVIAPRSGPVGAVPDAKQFDGNAQALIWTGIMPAGYGVSGKHRFLLRSEVLQEGTSLVLRFAPAEDLDKTPDWSLADSRVLVKGLVGWRIDYLDDRREPPGVQESWPTSNSLPARLVLHIQTAAGNWPDLVLPVREVSAPMAPSGPFVAGGRE